jgi:rubrerythrin
MNIREALLTAIDYEKRAQAAYAEAAESADDEDTKKILQMLAKDEEKHLRYMQDSFKLWTDTGQLQIAQLTSEIDFEKIRISNERLKNTLSGLRPTESRQKILKLWFKVLDVEIETHRFYKEVSEQLVFFDKEFFQRFVEMESKHLNLINSRINALNL